MRFQSIFGTRGVPQFAAIVATAALLSACASSGGGSSGGGGGGMFSPDPNRGVVTVQTEQTIPTEMFLRQGYCPPVQIRPGAESFKVYERGGEDDPNSIRYQASVIETARECTAAGPDTLNIKLGVRGRIAAGPKGGPGNVTVPLRVAVVKQHGGTVLYSQKFDIPATFSASQFTVDFQQVFDQVTVQLTPADRDLIVYVGYDGGPPKPAT